MKVKLFTKYELKDLEDVMNEFLEENRFIKVKDIKMSNTSDFYIAMVIYEEN